MSTSASLPPHDNHLRSIRDHTARSAVLLRASQAAVFALAHSNATDQKVRIMIRRKVCESGGEGIRAARALSRSLSHSTRKKAKGRAHPMEIGRAWASESVCNEERLVRRGCAKAARFVTVASHP